jgi:hypothetical protein
MLVRSMLHYLQVISVMDHCIIWLLVDFMYLCFTEHSFRNLHTVHATWTTGQNQITDALCKPIQPVPSDSLSNLQIIMHFVATASS